MTDTTATAGPVPADIPDYPMPRSAGCPFDPPSAMRALQEEAPITKVRQWDGSTPWLITRYDDQRALLTDPRLSSDVMNPHFPHQAAGLRARRQEAPAAFISMDDPEHARLRRMVTAPFAIKRMEALRPAIQKIVDGLIDDLLAGPRPADLVQAFALPLPSLVICELLGVPYAVHGFFQAKSKTGADLNATPEQTLTAQRELFDYVHGLVGDKLAHPGDDLLSDLAQRVRAGELTQRDAAGMGRLLLVAGHDTTANQIALATLALLQHPDQLALLRETDDPKLIAGAVEELMRYLSVTHTGRRRVAIADIEIGGQTIRAGDGVVLPAETANWDPAAFPDPGRLDLTRNARHHVAFGFGVHQCLGQPLARVELQVIYGTLYRRIPTLQLAVDPSQLQFKHHGTVYGVYELPVTW
jgi:cytochrome P450